MADEKKITIPDIGTTSQVEVIEILVKEGDAISKETPLVTLESDKASMDIPAPQGGTVKSVLLKVGDKVSEGDAILTLVPAESKEKASETADASPSSKKGEEKKEESSTPSHEDESKTNLQRVEVPDIGGASNVEVIEIFVKKGDEVKKDASLLTLESDKASMEIPSPFSGKVEEVMVSLGDKVSQGDVILKLMTAEKSEEKKEEEDTKKEKTKEAADKELKPASEFSSESPVTSSSVFAGPGVRRLAREFGVNLAEVDGSGKKSRITKEDVQQFIKERLKHSSSQGFSLPSSPSIDFSSFGEVEIKPLNKIKRLTGANLHRAWLTVPHVTQFDEADITELEAFRKKEAEEAKQQGYKLTLLAFVCKVVAKALAVFPQFNSSLEASGEKLVYKHYINIGVAVDTPNGLVVPVIKQVDKLSVREIAEEMGRLSSKARDKGLMPAEMNGGCFTISSLGGIGGTAFTPIVNTPEVAILGLSRAAIKPVYQQGEFVPRLILPLSLSYDHRVIDGAEAARFTQFIADALADIRKLLLS